MFWMSLMGQRIKIKGGGRVKSTVNKHPIWDSGDAFRNQSAINASRCGRLGS